MARGYEVIEGEVCKVRVPGGWPFEPGDYRVGNPYHPAAVVIPLGDSELESKALEHGCAIVGRCRTANVGIEKVVCNVVSNPNIRWLIVFGPESRGHLSGQALVALVENGVDPVTRRIRGARGQSACLPNLPLWVVERFRRQVRVVDAVGVTDPEVLAEVLHGVIQEPWNRVVVVVKGRRYELYDPGAYLEEEPVAVSLRELIRAEGRLVEVCSRYLSVVHARSIGEAYESILWLLENGPYVEVLDERGSLTRELLNLVVHVEEPLSEPMVPEGYVMTREELEEYAASLLDPDTRGFEYTYGERLLAYPSSSVDQLSYVVGKLGECQASRRAVATLWCPPVDARRDEVPCLVLLQFLVREGRLHLTGVLRSNDMVRAWPANAYALAKLMEYVAGRLGVGVGSLTTLSVSAHKYLS